MSVEEVSVVKLDSLIEQIGEAIQQAKNIEIREHLSEFKTKVEEMKVARVEIAHLDDMFHRGNLTEDSYLVKHKQLMRDFFAARDTITNSTAAAISRLFEQQNGNGKLSKLMQALKGNRDFVLAASQFILQVAATLSGKA